MKLTQKDKDKLWGDSGPYTEVKLIFETRILDDKVSRIFILVEVYINPLTFEIIKKKTDRISAAFRQQEKKKKQRHAG